MRHSLREVARLDGVDARARNLGEADVLGRLRAADGRPERVDVAAASVHECHDKLRLVSRRALRVQRHAENDRFILFDENRRERPLRHDRRDGRGAEVRRVEGMRRGGDVRVRPRSDGQDRVERRRSLVEKPSVHVAAHRRFLASAIGNDVEAVPPKQAVLT